MKKKLALVGGEPTFKYEDMPKELFHWPIITKEDEEAVLDVVRTNNFSGVDITMQLEKEFAEWQEVKETMVYFPSGRKECFVFKTNDGREVAVKARFCEVCYVFEK